MNKDTGGQSDRIHSNLVVQDLDPYLVYHTTEAYTKGAIVYTNHASRFYVTNTVFCPVRTMFFKLM